MEESPTEVEESGHDESKLEDTIMISSSYLQTSKPLLTDSPNEPSTETIISSLQHVPERKRIYSTPLGQEKRVIQEVRSE